MINLLHPLHPYVLDFSSQSSFNLLDPFSVIFVNYVARFNKQLFHVDFAYNYSLIGDKKYVIIRLRCSCRS